MNKSNVVFRSGLVVAVMVLAGVRPAEAGRELGVLEKLVGRWKIDEEYPPVDGAPKGTEGKGDVTLKEALDNACLLGEYDSKSRDSGIEVEGHQVFTYNPETRAYRYWWFDNYGNTWDFHGTYDSGANALVFTRQFEDSQTGQQSGERHTFKFEDENTIIFKMELGDDRGGYELALTTTYTRRGTTRKETPVVTPAPVKPKEPAENEEKPKKGGSRPKRAVGRGG